MDWSSLLDALTEILAEMGSTGWLVGGCLRDALLGLPAGDVDVALTVAPVLVAERLAQRLPLAIARLGRGTVRLVPRDDPGQHLDLSALAGATITDDLARRDFTVNALALPLSARARWIARARGQRADMPGLLDPYRGRDDLRAGRLVAIGPEVFRDDPGRIIRAARLAARFGLWPNAATWEQARAAVPLLATLSTDRLREEMTLLLALANATRGVELVWTLGALAVLYPGLEREAAIHALDTLRRLDMLMNTTPPTTALYPALTTWSASAMRRVALRLAALRHALDDHPDTHPANASSSGKQVVLWQTARDVLNTEDPHERLIAARLLFERGHRDENAAADALLIAAACALASGDLAQGETLAARADGVMDVYLHSRPTLIPPLLLRGGDLIAALGLPPGAAVGRLLREVRLAQLADAVTTHDEALALARRLYETHG